MQKLSLTSPKKIERQINKLMSEDPESKFIFRLCSLKMYLNDPECSADRLGKIMQKSPRTVANWIHALNSSGDIDVLRDKPKPGRTNRLTERQMEELKQQLQKQPREVGVDANL